MPKSLTESLYPLTARCDACALEGCRVRRTTGGAWPALGVSLVCEICDLIPPTLARDNLGVALSRLTRLVLKHVEARTVGVAGVIP
jgi:hypothetical protein